MEEWRIVMFMDAALKVLRLAEAALDDGQPDRARQRVKDAIRECGTVRDRLTGEHGTTASERPTMRAIKLSMDRAAAMLGPDTVTIVRAGWISYLLETLDETLQPAEFGELLADLEKAIGDRLEHGRW